MPKYVSIMMPCYNAESTIMRAISSVLAQNYPYWECILVNDGSVDNTGALIKSIADPRLKVVDFPENRGRGVARQAALDVAEGDYLSFLDADDWLYPDKLARQVEIMETHPALAAVSCKFTAVSPTGEFQGFLWALAQPSSDVEVRTFEGLKRPPLNYGSSMLRMDLAKRHRYNPDLRRAQDMDFMINALQGQMFAIQPEAGYVYTGWEPRAERSAEAFMYERRMYRSHARKFPFQAAYRIVENSIKSLAASAVLNGNMVDSLSRSRLALPNDQERQEFCDAQKTVQEVESTLAGLAIGI